MSLINLNLHFKTIEQGDFVVSIEMFMFVIGESDIKTSIIFGREKLINKNRKKNVKINEL